MKKVYEAPSVEKIAFDYRDQVVVASPGPGEIPGDPQPGQWTNSPGTSGCSYYLAEALGLRICGIM